MPATAISDTARSTFLRPSLTASVADFWCTAATEKYLGDWVMEDLARVRTTGVVLDRKDMVAVWYVGVGSGRCCKVFLRIYVLVRQSRRAVVGLWL